MRRRFDDEDERPNWLGRLIKGIIAGAVVSGAAVAAISLYLLPPPAPPPPPGQQASAGEDGGPKVIDGIEVSSEPAYFGMTRAEGEADATAAAAVGESAAPPAETGPVELDGPALVANAEPFEAVPDMPLVAVVLDDVGANPMLHEMLFTLDMPLTVGVLAGGAGDRVIAAAAREAGFEVVAQLPLAGPGEAGGGALEYGLPSGEAAERTALLMRRLPMAVAASLPLAAPAPPDRNMAKGIMAELGPMGFAWLEHGVGRGESPTVRPDGLERIVGVSRLTIPAGANAAEAHAALDRAAAAAAENGAVIVFAAADEAMLLALQLWAGTGEAGIAQLAPLSAAIRRQNGGDILPEPDPPAAPAEAAQAREPAAN